MNVHNNRPTGGRSPVTVVVQLYALKTGEIVQDKDNHFFVFPNRVYKKVRIMQFLSRAAVAFGLYFIIFGHSRRPVAVSDKKQPQNGTHHTLF
jgi:hypothetical protein